MGSNVGIIISRQSSGLFVAVEFVFAACVPRCHYEVFLLEVRYPLGAVPHGDMAKNMVFHGGEYNEVANLVLVVSLAYFLKANEGEVVPVCPCGKDYAWLSTGNDGFHNIPCAAMIAFRKTMGRDVGCRSFLIIRITKPIEQCGGYYDYQ